MRLNRLRVSLSAVAGASALFGATAFVPASAPAVSAAAPAAVRASAAAGRDCRTVEGLVERTTQAYPVGTAAQPMQNAGDAVSYYDEIRDADGAVVGHAVGYVTVRERRASDGHLIVFYDESVQLPGGILHDSGVVDETAVEGGAWARFKAVGTAGGFRGKRGTREWKLDPAAQLTAFARVVLCG